MEGKPLTVRIRWSTLMHWENWGCGVDMTRRVLRAFETQRFCRFLRAGKLYGLLVLSRCCSQAFARSTEGQYWALTGCGPLFWNVLTYFDDRSFAYWCLQPIQLRRRRNAFPGSWATAWQVGRQVDRAAAAVGTWARQIPNPLIFRFNDWVWKAQG